MSDGLSSYFVQQHFNVLEKNRICQIVMSDGRSVLHNWTASVGLAKYGNFNNIKT
jgi:hypothetical protein